MRRKWLWIGFFCVLAGGAACYFMRSALFSPVSSEREITDLSNTYQAEEEIQQAEEKLSASPVPAQIIVNDLSGRRCAAIVLDGLPDGPMTSRILDLLQKHHMAAAFFVEGQNAADQPDTMKLLKESGQEIGNYTFVGIASPEKLPTRTLLRELCQTQKAVGVFAGTTPEMFRGPRVQYTTDLLRALSAAGLKYAAKENVRYVRGSVKSSADADAWASKIASGSIIAVPINTPAELRDMEPGKTDERPAIDKKPTLPLEGAEIRADQPADFLTELEYLLAALEKQGFSIEPVSSFRYIRYIPTGLPTVHTAIQKAGSVTDARTEEQG